MPETTLLKARFQRVEQRNKLREATFESIGVWTVELQCEDAGDVYSAYAVECNPAIWPERRYLLVVSTGDRRAFASVSHAGEVTPTTNDDLGRPCPKFPKRIWERAVHAVERARTEDSYDA